MMMRNRPIHSGLPRGLTLMEMMLALTITAMIAGAIAGMMAAVSSDVGSRRDTRSVMVRANAAQSRLSAYILPARAFLEHSTDHLVIWLNDSRASDSAHASEVRWVMFDSTSGAIDVVYISFPNNWTQSQIDLADTEYTANSNWLMVLRDFEMRDLANSIRLVDGLADCRITLDNDPSALASRLAGFELEFQATDSTHLVRSTFGLRLHQPPAF